MLLHASIYRALSIKKKLLPIRLENFTMRSGDDQTLQTVYVERIFLFFLPNTCNPIHWIFVRSLTSPHWKLQLTHQALIGFLNTRKRLSQVPIRFNRAIDICKKAPDPTQSPILICCTLPHVHISGISALSIPFSRPLNSLNTSPDPRLAPCGALIGCKDDLFMRDFIKVGLA